MQQELRVSVDSIAAPGQTDAEMVPPEVGDSVQIMAEGRVSRVDQGEAVVALESGNGDPLPQVAEERPKTRQEEIDAEERELRRELGADHY